jgi:6-phosphogluconolactonase
VFVQRIACGGKAPRQFTLDPTGRWLLCGNQDSGSITIFSRDEANGHLSGPVQTVPAEMPQMILFV